MTMFDVSAIEKLAEAQAIGAANVAVVGAAPHQPLVALPEGYTMHNLENVQIRRQRARGAMKTHVLEAFAAYVEQFKKEGSTAFVNGEVMSATAVLNLGTVTCPGHADDTATFHPKQTAAYQAMQSILAGGRQREVSQQTAAEFVEDWAAFIIGSSEPDADGMAHIIHPPKVVGAFRSMTIEHKRKLDSQERSLGHERSELESVQASSLGNTVPVELTFKCMPYIGFNVRTFRIRVGVVEVEARGGMKPAFVFRLINAEQHAEELAEELQSIVASTLGDSVPCHIGTYTAKG